MNKEQFIGSWRLVSWQNHIGTRIEYPMGRDARGFIHYTADNYMAVTLMRADRSVFSSGDLKGSNVDERAAAYETFLGYSGTYELLEDRVIHRIEVSSFPNWKGANQVRYYHFEGLQLVLSTDPVLYNGEEVRARLVWERV